MLTSPPSTKDRLLRSAVKLVARDGFAATTTAAIAAETGLAEGTLYRHFPSKDDLLIEAYRGVKAKVFAAITAAHDSQGDPAERLKHLWLTLIEAYRSDTDTFIFGQRFAESALAAREGGMAHEQIGAGLTRLRDAGVAAGVFKDLPVDILSNLFFGPVSYMVKSEIGGRHWTPSELSLAADAVVDAWRA
jgi:AcrR family transcriptional regulator